MLVRPAVLSWAAPTASLPPRDSGGQQRGGAARLRVPTRALRVGGDVSQDGRRGFICSAAAVAAFCAARRSASAKEKPSAAPRCDASKAPCPDDGEEMTAFFQWGLENKVKGLDQVEVAFFEAGGSSVRGLAATVDLVAEPRKPKPILEIPPSLVLTSANPRLKQSAFHELAGQLLWKDTWALPLDMALYLAAERRRGADSFWYPWIRVMPTPEDYAAFHPFYAPSEVLQKYSAIPVVDMLRLDNKDLVTTWAELQPWLQKNAPDVTFDDFKWASASFYTRGFTLLEGNETVAMAPFIDMCNTRADNAVNAGYQAKSSQAPFRLAVPFKRRISKGEQILITYSKYPAAEWFAVYGFLPSEKGLPRPDALSKQVCSSLQDLRSQAPSAAFEGNFQSLVPEYCR
eukprot:TRINITY_DN41552_c0_g1_i3.p1 TRINITY_DN41552_c0_g1~~TRINITY_DN41552_c0_g1_i3.p1  ORF type:complete len:402 (-),score=79.58 TRINITY_DN41552_c0_g1_i3:493-1698(-)